MFNSIDALKHYENIDVFNYVFNKYLNNKECREDRQNKPVYDSLGPIDTLGYYRSDAGINHFSYLDEVGSVFAIKQTKMWFVCCDYGKKEVFIFKGSYFKNN